MRFGEKCEDCGKVENRNWRPRFADTATDYLEFENALDLIGIHKPGDEWIDGQWAYRIPKTGSCLLRLLTVEYKARGSFNHPRGLGKDLGFKKQMASFNHNKTQTKLIEVLAR